MKKDFRATSSPLGTLRFSGAPPTLHTSSDRKAALKEALSRNLARKRWAYHWDNEKLDLVPEGEAEPSSADAAGRGREHGFSDEEVAAAVRSALTGTELHELHEAATILREVTTSGDEACLGLIRQNVLRGLLRMLSDLHDQALEEDAVVCLLNMLAHQQPSRIIADQGVLLPLVECLKGSVLSSTKANVAAALAIITRSETQTWALMTSGAIPALLQMLERARVSAATPKAAGLFPGSPSVRSQQRGGILFSPSLSSAGDNSVHDACLALMHLAKFKTIRRALIKLEVVPLLADVAKVASLVDSEQSLAALFQLLAKAEGGPQAICIEHNGVGAGALVSLALKGMDTTQELALDALIAVAAASDSCSKALVEKGVVEKLSSYDSFVDADESVRKKVLSLRNLLSC